MSRFGLLGRKLGHSYSPQIHKLLGSFPYELYEKEPEELGDFLKNGSWDGLNVTVPYKKAVIPYCTALTPLAESLGSVNTLLRRKDGSILGDNTDHYGFRRMAQSLAVDYLGKKALVFGSGGASLSAQAVLRELGCAVTVISRQGEHNYHNLSRHLDAHILVNCTPLGMYPHNGESPCRVSDFPRAQAVLDVVYNPGRTALIMEAEELGILHAGGLAMLVAQAARAAELFLDKDIPKSLEQEVLACLVRRTESMILIGMPGCGKTTLGRLLAERTGRVFYDSDEELARYLGQPVPEYLETHGEKAFRGAEAHILRELGKKAGIVLATGGGCVVREENYRSLHQNGRILWLERELSALPAEGRPLSQKQSPEALYQARAPLYRRFCDCQVENNGTPEEALGHILEVLP